jgi:thioredoxin 1
MLGQRTSSIRPEAYHPFSPFNLSDIRSKAISMHRVYWFAGFAMVLAGCTQEIGVLNEALMGDGTAVLLPHSANQETVDVRELVFRSKTPVVLDFSATWCGPCRTLAPEMDKLAEEYAGKAVVAKIAIDANPGIASYFRIEGVPTVLVLKDARILKRTVGFDRNIRSKVGRIIDGS